MYRNSVTVYRNSVTIQYFLKFISLGIKRSKAIEKALQGFNSTAQYKDKSM
jgi:hypothetical protein